MPCLIIWALKLQFIKLDPLTCWTGLGVDSRSKNSMKHVMLAVSSDNKNCHHHLKSLTPFCMSLMLVEVRLLSTKRPARTFNDVNGWSFLMACKSSVKHGRSYLYIYLHVGDFTSDQSPICSSWSPVKRDRLLKCLPAPWIFSCEERHLSGLSMDKEMICSGCRPELVCSYKVSWFWGV